MEQSITFAGGRAKWVFQEGDGNVVLYHDDVPVWATNTVLPTRPSQPMIEVTLGNWRGNFMYDKTWYFGPSLLAWPADMRQAYYQWTRDRGYTHLWANAQQANWDARYTRGGFDAFDGDGSLAHLVTVLREIREAQLIPCLGIHDQPQAASLPWEQLIDQTQRCIDATCEHVAIYMIMGWELNENSRWSTGIKRNPAIIEMFQRLKNRGRDLGVHYAPPPLGNLDEGGEEDEVYGGYQLWKHLPAHAVRLQQIPKDATDDQLRSRTHAAMIVNRDTGTKLCAFEHSRMSVPGRDVHPSRSLDNAQSRAALCLDVMRPDMPQSRTGSMNG